jgi:hypothetical protein
LSNKTIGEDKRKKVDCVGKNGMHKADQEQQVLFISVDG